eukprot:GCRY01003610.1.p1 GENE.GCRY01003610.1~~GCRY01003610.1.p1  ORF type:complete len:537 (-),score=118.62 GCRY01003610.1:179-1789(-)
MNTNTYSLEKEKRPNAVSRVFSSLRFFTYRRPFVHINFTVGEMVVLLLYFGVNMVLILKSLLSSWHQTSPWDPYHHWYQFAKKMGKVALFNIVIMILPALRNSPLVFIFGISFDRAIKFHRWFSRWGIFTILVHTISFWPSFIHWKELKKTAFGTCADQYIYVFYGYIALYAGLVLGLLALGQIRRRFFTFFQRAHRVLAIVFLVFLYLHRPHHTAVLLGVLVGLYAIDLLIRWLPYLKSKNDVVAQVDAFPNNVLRVRFNKRTFPHYHAAQMIQIKFPLVSSFETHPYSLATAPWENYPTIYVKGLGDWSMKANRTVQKLISNSSDIELSHPTTLSHPFPAVVEGPYGRLCLPLEHYANIIMFAAGVGITPMRSQLAQLLHEHKTGRKVPLQKVKLIWTVPEHSMIHALLHKDHEPPSSAELQADTVPDSFLPIATYLAPFGVFEVHFFVDGPVADSDKGVFGSYVRYGRPDIQGLLRSMAPEMDSSSTTVATSHVAVMTCGPPGMNTVVRHASSRLSKEKNMPQYDYHYESFIF